MDPATFTRAKALAFARAGVNRASVGVQIFDDALLARCNRVHRVADVYAAVGDVRFAGFGNISLDLNSGLPGQTADIWGASLDAAVGLGPEHVSCYDLELEKGTRFGETYAAGEAPLPSDWDAAEMVHAAVERLGGAGYDHYEVSSYARDGRYVSVHNSAYWENRYFYGFGLGATSLLAGPGAEEGGSFRFERPRDMAVWEKYVRGLSDGGGEIGAGLLFPGVKARDEEERLLDHVINSMRLIHSGVSFDGLVDSFGGATAARVQDAALKSGLKEIGLIAMDARGVRLTEKGALFETTVLCGLLGF